MERKIDEIFEFNEVKLKTLQDDVSWCKSCYFNNNTGFCRDMKCLSTERTDNESVIFKEIKEL